MADKRIGGEALRIFLLLAWFAACCQAICCPPDSASPTVSQNSFFLRSERTGWLYGPFQGVDVPRRDSYTVLRVPDQSVMPDADISENKNVHVRLYVYYDSQPIPLEQWTSLEKELFSLERYSLSVKSQRRTIQAVSHAGETNAWILIPRDPQNLEIFRADPLENTDFVTTGQLQVHAVLSGVKIQEIDFISATIQDVVRKLEAYIPKVEEEPVVTFSIEGDEKEWSEILFFCAIKEIEIVALLEYLLDSCMGSYFIDGSVVRLRPPGSVDRSVPARSTEDRSAGD